MLEKQSYLGRLVRLGATLLCHPLSLLTIACTLDTIKEFGLWEKPPLELLIGCIDATKRALMYSVANRYIYGIVNFSIACSFLLPIWILLWIINVSWINAPEISIHNSSDEASESISKHTLENEEQEDEEDKE